MSAAEGVVFAFLREREWAQSAQFPVGAELFATSSEDFMTIGLMPHVPHNPVTGCVEHIMQGYGQLHYTQA